MEELIREHVVIMRTVGELIEVPRNHSNKRFSIDRRNPRKEAGDGAHHRFVSFVHCRIT